MWRSLATISVVLNVMVAVAAQGFAQGDHYLPLCLTGQSSPEVAP
jgi:hypothetical protein